MNIAQLEFSFHIRHIMRIFSFSCSLLQTYPMLGWVIMLTLCCFRFKTTRDTFTSKLDHHYPRYKGLPPTPARDALTIQTATLRNQSLSSLEFFVLETESSYPLLTSHFIPTIIENSPSEFPFTSGRPMVWPRSNPHFDGSRRCFSVKLPRRIIQERGNRIYATRRPTA